MRDLTGQTGWKLLAGRFENRDALFGSQLAASGTGGFAIVVAVMFVGLSPSGHGALVLMWPTAFLTSYLLFARLRQVAEHAGVPDLFDPDPRRNTRTTHARWWERILVAPNFVNFHLEHHLAAAVPCYRLPAFHDLLAERHAYDHTEFPEGYLAVLRSVTIPA